MTLPGSGCQERADDRSLLNILDGLLTFPARGTLSPSLPPLKAFRFSGARPQGRSHLSTGPQAPACSQPQPNSDLRGGGWGPPGFFSLGLFFSPGFVVSAGNRMRTESLPETDHEGIVDSLNRAHSDG